MKHFKQIAAAAIAAATLAGCKAVTTDAAYPTCSDYPATAVVEGIEAVDGIARYTVRDSAGSFRQFSAEQFRSCQQVQPGDMIALIMDDHGTADTRDDSVKEARPAGFQIAE